MLSRKTSYVVEVGCSNFKEQTLNRIKTSNSIVIIDNKSEELKFESVEKMMFNVFERSIFSGGVKFHPMDKDKRRVDVYIRMHWYLEFTIVFLGMFLGVISLFVAYNRIVKPFISIPLGFEIPLALFILYYLFRARKSMLYTKKGIDTINSLLEGASGVPPRE